MTTSDHTLIRTARTGTERFPLHSLREARRLMGTFILNDQFFGSTLVSRNGFGAQMRDKDGSEFSYAIVESE